VLDGDEDHEDKSGGVHVASVPHTTSQTPPSLRESS
jgi:hypothetical protein